MPDASILPSPEPGSEGRGTLATADPQTGVPVSVPVVVSRGAEEGPALCLVCAQHGVEVNGTAAVHLLLRRLDLSELKGTLISLPVANPLAARIKRSAYPTDHGWTEECPFNMNRVWPGDPEGDLTHRLAALLWEQCIECSSAVVDFHSHAPQYGPQALARATSDASVELAKAFGVPRTHLTDEKRQGLLYDLAAQHGKASILVELPPLRMVDPASVRLALRGLKNALASLRMAPWEVRQTEVGLIRPGGQVRSWQATTDGLVIGHVEPGSIVSEGELVAELVDLYTFMVAEEIRAPFRGIVTQLGCPMKYIDSYDTDLANAGELFCQIAEL